MQLVGILAGCGDLDEAEQVLRARADAGDRLRRFGLNPDWSIACT